MNFAHPLSAFLPPGYQPSNSLPAYWYEGGEARLPRTELAEAIARGLMQRLAQGDQPSEGKMCGILLVETPAGEQRVLQGFSGLLRGCSQVAGWVPPIPVREQVAIAEARTLTELATLKQEIIALQQLPERQQYLALAQDFERRLQELSEQQQRLKQARQQQRQHLQQILTGEALTTALTQLDNQSRREGGDRRRLKQERDQALWPLSQAIAQSDDRLRELKRQRRQTSRQLQAQLHAAYQLTNFAGESIVLQQLTSGGLPTGTGDCCAPKLLHFAATHGLQPLAMAEFWWGTPSAKGDKVPGEFYPACEERCQPLMGFLLSGLRSPAGDALPILYQDDWLIVVDKPAGLLSVPGRYLDRQDSVLSRLRLQFGDPLVVAHRLDQDTSGVLVLARNPATHRHLMRQFQQRQVSKTYEAILDGVVAPDRGVIDLPLSANLSDRPRQRVDPLGKSSITRFEVIERRSDRTRLAFFPLTGRTHQLRVHAADRAGLGLPIWGDRLYGTAGDRLHLHAKEICFQHPHSGQKLHLQTLTPF